MADHLPNCLRLEAYVQNDRIEMFSSLKEPSCSLLLVDGFTFTLITDKYDLGACVMGRRYDIQVRILRNEDRIFNFSEKGCNHLHHRIQDS